MKYLLTLCIITILAMSASAQVDTLWTNTYGDKPSWDGYDQLYGATPTFDGGFAMNGYSTSYGDTVKGDQWVVKINASGDTLWTAPFGDFDRRDYGRDIIETYDHNLVVCGHGRVANTSEDYRIRLFKVDSLGNELWDKNYVGANGFSTEKIVETADRGFAICGWTDDKDFFLFRADSLGDSVWCQTYGGVDDDIAYDLVQTADDGFLVIGSSESYGTGSWDIYLVRTDEVGDTVWTRAYGTVGYEEGRAIAHTHDGNYLVAGSIINTNTDCWFLKVEDDGDTLWTNVTGQDAANDSPYGITATSDNGFLVAGRNYNTVNFHNSMYILKINASADSVWSYTLINNTHDEGQVAFESAGGTCYLFGTRAPSSAGSYRDYWALALDVTMDVPFGPGDLLPESFSLAQNYPNPFNPGTTVKYNVAARSRVTIEIFNVVGQRVRTLVNREHSAGDYQVYWDGGNDDGAEAATGVYFYKLTAGDVTQSRKMLLLK